MKKIILSVLLFTFSVNIFADNNAMLFVSLGMPKPVLRQYLLQSQQYHIPLILRGLIDNQYPTTAKKIFGILHPKNGAEIKSGFEIDPLYFRQYQINAVPALVVFNPNNKNHYTIIYGNIPIQQSLALIAQKSQYLDIKNSARNILEKKP